MPRYQFREPLAIAAREQETGLETQFLPHETVDTLHEPSRRVPATARDGGTGLAAEETELTFPVIT